MPGWKPRALPAAPAGSGQRPHSAPGTGPGSQTQHCPPSAAFCQRGSLTAGLPTACPLAEMPRQGLAKSEFHCKPLLLTLPSSRGLAIRATPQRPFLQTMGNQRPCTSRFVHVRVKPRHRANHTSEQFIILSDYNGIWKNIGTQFYLLVKPAAGYHVLIS